MPNSERTHLRLWTGKPDFEGFAVSREDTAGYEEPSAHNRVVNYACFSCHYLISISFLSNYHSSHHFFVKDKYSATYIGKNPEPLATRLWKEFPVFICKAGKKESSARKRRPTAFHFYSRQSSLGHSESNQVDNPSDQGAPFSDCHRRPATVMV